jgi:uncharacterized MAPEG superfamily protein
MTTELYWMTLTVLMTSLYWLPYILDRLIVRGVIPALTDTKPETGDRHSLWAQRSMRAHANAVENLAIFVPAVLIAHAVGLSTALTANAAMVYFFARLVHFVAYSAGIPVVRTVCFAVGWACQFVFLATILGIF